MHASRYLLTLCASGEYRLIDTGLRSDDHGDAKLALVHEAIVEIEESGQAVDEGLVFDRSAAKGLSPDDITHALSAYGTNRTASQLAEDIGAASTWRRLGARVSSSAKSWASVEPEKRDAFRDALTAALESGAESVATRKPITHKEALDALIKSTSEARERGGVGFPTGIAGFDRMVGGIGPGRMYTLAAETSAGKSCMALQWAAKIQASTPCLYWSGEMTAAECLGRQMCQAKDSSLTADMLRDGRIDEATWLGALRATGKMAIEYDTRTATVEELAALVRRWHRRTGGQVVFVDLLNAIRPSEGDSRANQVGHITRTLKGLTLDLPIAVVLVAHLNRDSYRTGQGKKRRPPGNADLKDSSSIEQDSDVVAFIHPEDADFRNFAEWRGTLGVTKARIGRCGITGIAFIGREQRFYQPKRQESVR